MRNWLIESYRAHTHHARFTKRFAAIATAALLCAPFLLSSTQATAEDWNAKFQSTYIWQTKPSFDSPYSGAHSFSGDHEKSYSFTGTMSLGFRTWKGGELYVDPEVTQGVPLSGSVGLGGFTNGEVARAGGTSPTFYRARLFLRQTWGEGGGSEEVDSDMDQLGGSVDKKRWVLTAGNLSVLDIFDGNSYAHDPRTQFMNYALITNGAYDYPADTHGYTWGAALEYYGGGWAARAGRFILPREPNQLRLDYRIADHYGDQVEFERDYSLGSQPGKVRLLAFRNRALMSRYRDALDAAALAGGTPDVNNVRNSDQTKWGVGVNIEQALSKDVGLFARAMHADGKTEVYSFAEVDDSASAGAVIQGTRWGRPDDTVGLAVAVDGLSSLHRQYLAAGGLGFFLGDGQLNNYRTENIFEGYYNWNVTKWLWLSFDYQHIAHPGYNADRGPVDAAAVRLHVEF